MKGRSELGKVVVGVGLTTALAVEVVRLGCFLGWVL